MAGNQTVQSVERALDLLQATASRSEGLSLAELCEQTGLKSTTAHNLVRTLAERGFLARQTGPTRYRLGSAAFELVDRQREAGLLKTAQPFLRQLHQHYPDAAVTVAQPRDYQMAIVLRLSPQRRGLIEQPTDKRLHPYVSASAMVYLAYAGPDVRAAHARAFAFEEEAGHAWRDPAAFDAALDEVKHKGLAVLTERTALIPMAAPVWRDGEFVAALGLALPKPDSQSQARKLADAAARHVKTLAEELSETLDITAD